MMQREEFDRLLAGYATNQLSGEERARLIEAAMADQSMFNAMADEDALRETLADPQLKAELLRTLEPEIKQSYWSWLRKPQTWALAGTAAVAALAFVFLIQPKAEKAKQAEIAQSPAPPAPIAENKVLKSESPVKRVSKSSPVALHRREERETQVADKKLNPQPEIAELKKAEEPRKDANKEEVSVVAAAPAQVPIAVARPATAFRAADEVSSMQARSKVAMPVLRYTVLRKNDLGEFIETAAGTILAKGDSIRLAVTSSNRGYISLTEPESNRQIYFGFAEPGVRYVIPALGAVTLDAGGTDKRMRLSLMMGAGNAASQSQAATENLGNAVQNTGPISQSAIEIIVRYR